LLHENQGRLAAFRVMTFPVYAHSDLFLGEFILTGKGLGFSCYWWVLWLALELVYCEVDVSLSHAIMELVRSMASLVATISIYDRWVFDDACTFRAN